MDGLVPQHTSAAKVESPVKEAARSQALPEDSLDRSLLRKALPVPVRSCMLPMTDVLKSLLLVALLTLATSGSPALASDCNGNGVSDLEDISRGFSEDCDVDAIPDECEASPPPFGSIRSLNARAMASSFAITDLDGDGLVDIAVGTGPSDSFGITLFLAAEGGQFEASPARLESTREVLDIVAADLDGDGRPDLILRDAGGIRGYFNRGPDGFGSRFTVSTRDDMSAIAAADLNGDGRQDVIASQEQGNLLAVLLSEGDGAFDPLPDYEISAPSEMAIGDVNGDGHNEVVVAGADGLSILGSVGNGELVRLQTLNGLVGRPHSPMLGDIDQDGRLDIVLATDAGVFVLMNQEADAFVASRVYRVDDPEHEVTAMAAGDVDEDGDLDLVLAIGRSGAPGELVYLTNDGGGSFRFTLPFGLETSPDHLALEDLDEDGDSELLLLAGGRTRIEILWNEPGTLTPRPFLSFREEWVPLSDNFEPHVSHLRDVDKDGDLDVVTMDGEDLVMVVTNDGYGSLSEGERYRLDGSDEIIAIVSVDFDNDGYVDIAANDERVDELYVLLNRGDGTFVSSGVVYSTGDNPAFLASADIDGDGFPDLLSVHRGDDTVGIFFNLHAGTFAAQMAIEVCDYPVGAAPGDFDGDGHVDLAVICSGSSTLSVLHNQGNGTFGPGVDLEIATPRYVIAVDMDADQDLDLVVAHEDDRSLGVFLNDGEGIFELSDVVGIDGRPRSVLACEVNGDGRVDLVAANEQDDSISVVVSPEVGVPPHVFTYGVGRDPRYAMAGDIDGNGTEEILSANHTSYDFTALFNETEELLPSPPAYLESICTELDFYDMSVASTMETGVERATRFLIPVVPSPVPPLFENTREFADQREFLVAVFPEMFAGLTEAEYDLLVRNRASRQYYSGTVYRLRSRYGFAYGFDIVANTAVNDEEVPTAEEVRSVHESLEGILAMAPLAYYPVSSAARRAAALWVDPHVPIYMEPYQRGDATADGEINLTDAICLLDYLFRGRPAPVCLSAADINQDGDLDVSDSITLLLYLYLGRYRLGPPSVHCGWDPTPDTLGCMAFPACEE